MKMLPIIFLIFFGACRFDVPEPTPNTGCRHPIPCDTFSHDNRMLELLWQVPFESGPDLNLINTIKLYKNDVIAYYWDFQDNQIRLMSCKKDSGTVNYRFKFSKEQGEGDPLDYLEVIDDWVGLATDYDAGFVNLLTGQELLIPEDKFCFMDEVKVHGKLFYRNVWSCNDKITHLFSYDIFNGNKVDTVLTRTYLDHPAGARFSSTPIFYESEADGQTYVIMNNFGIGTNIIPTSEEYICYNLKNKSIKWKVDKDFGQTPVIDGRYCYLGTPEGELNKIDLETGELIWTFLPEHQHASFVLSTGFIKNDILYTLPINDVLYALDKHTGAVLWKGKQRLSGFNGGPIYVNGKIIIGLYQAMAVYDAMTGKELAFEKAWNYKWGTRFESSRYDDQNMAVDLQNNLLYCSDGFYLQCFKVK